MEMKLAALSIILVVALAGCTQAGSGKPSDTVRAAIEATAALDYDKFLTYMTAELAAQSAGLKPGFDQLKQAGVTMHLNKFNVLNEQASNDTARVDFEYEITATYNGKTQDTGLKTSYATLKKENGAWKIDGPAAGIVGSGNNTGN